MPNPGRPHEPRHVHLSVVDNRWRVHLCYVHERGHTAQFERWHEGTWQPIGPTAASRRSEILALARLAEGYRSFADALEKRWCFTSSGRLLDGCPRCGYTHIQVYENNGHACWRCIACNSSNSKRL